LAMRPPPVGVDSDSAKPLPRVVTRRRVYHVAGYDPIGAAWYRVFKRELVTFTRTWNVASEISDLMSRSGTSNARWKVTTRAPNWHVETTYEPLLWDDIVLKDRSQPLVKRLARSCLAFFDFVMSGAAFRYFKANWQYGLFFLYPFLWVFVFAAVAVALGYWVASLLALATVWHVALVVVVSLVVFTVLLHWPGQRLRVQHGLDDWIFSFEYVHNRRPDVEARLDHFAETLVAGARDTALDEIIIVGHSMGATFALEIVTRALALDPNLGRHGPAVCLLTVGSTVPKFTLHPAGERFRRHAARVADEPSIAWAEYQARADAISFYKFDPVARSRFYVDPVCSKPVIRRVQIHDMLTKQTYRRFRLRFMRLHYQFVMANERRSTYDYFMMVCGPIPFARSTLNAGGHVEAIAPDGALIEPVAPAPGEASMARGESASAGGLSRNKQTR
jgi:pimeloyl-ACP methyl ester carboxylesterase